MNWLLDHWLEFVEGLGAFLTLATVITRMTPTPKDDELLAKLVRFIGRWSVLEHYDQPRGTKAIGRKAGTQEPPHPDDMDMGD